MTSNGAPEGITVAEVVAGTALANSGLQVGDVIVSVNGVPVSGPAELAQLPPPTGSGQNCLDTVSVDGQQRTHCWGR